MKKIACVCILLLIFMLMLSSCNETNDKTGEETTSSTVSVTEPDFSAPNNEKLTFEEILLKEEFSAIYPRKGFENMKLTTSVNYLYDELANPKDEVYLATIWQGGDKQISITIKEETAEAFADVSDEKNYKLSAEPDIRYNENGEEYIPKVCFRPQDISSMVIKNRTVATEKGGYDKLTDISIYFEPYIVTYEWRSDEINENDVFELITSAEIYPISQLETTVRLDNEFLITLSCEQFEFKKEDAENIHYIVSVEYIGDEKSVQIWCGGSVSAFVVENSVGESVYPGAIATILRTDKLKRNEPDVTEFTGEHFLEFLEFDGKELTPGTYTLTAFGNFGTDDNTKNYNFSLELPLIIK